MTKYAIALTSLLLASGCAYRGEMGAGGASVQTGASVSGGGSDTYASSRLMRDNDHHAMLNDDQTTAGVRGSARMQNNSARADVDATRADVRDTAEIALHEEQLHVNKQQVPNGGVLLRKVVRSESVSQPVELRREEIQIQRLTADEARGRNADTANLFEGQEIFIPLTREQPVVSKESRVREIVRAGKRVETEQRNVADTIRREDIEIVENVDRTDLQGLGRSSTSVQSGGASSGQESNTRSSQLNATATGGATAGQSGPVFRGTIRSVDVENRRLTVEGENGQTMQFTLSDQPNLTIKENRYPSLIDFKVGYPVNIGYSQSSDGNHVAHSVIRQDAPEVR